jgi:hypothetical protein
LVAPLWRLVAADLAASPDPAEPASSVASFMPELFLWASRVILLRNIDLSKSKPSNEN